MKIRQNSLKGFIQESSIRRKVLWKIISYYQMSRFYTRAMFLCLVVRANC